MAEIPSNILLAEEFANSSTVLDRLQRSDAADVWRRSRLGDGRTAIRRTKRSGPLVVRAPHRSGAPHGRKVGICGQAPVITPISRVSRRARIDSISLSPDALVRTTLRVFDVEAKLSAATADPKP